MNYKQSSISISINEDILQKTKKLAVIDKRSLNMEIEFILEQYIKNYEDKNNCFIEVDDILN